MRAAARGYQASDHEPPPPHDHDVALAWHHNYSPPDKRAAEYAARYRSTYVGVFAFAAAALACAAAALSVAEFRQILRVVAPEDWHTLKFWMTTAELAALLVILGLVALNLRREWHQRSIDYRLLAELCRKQQALAVLGWSLSGRAVQALVEQHAGDRTPERAAWVIWLFAAMSRAAPMLRGAVDAARRGRARELVLHYLVDEQIQYHHGRLTLCERAAHGFAVFGEAVFVLVILVVAAKLALLLQDQTDWRTAVLGLAAAALPAIAAASIGVRAYAELELLADQSRRMREAMKRAKQRMRDLDLTRPLASQELGAEVLEVATRMLQDVDGWARLFRVKLVETG